MMDKTSLTLTCAVYRTPTYTIVNFTYTCFFTTEMNTHRYRIGLLQSGASERNLMYRMIDGV